MGFWINMNTAATLTVGGTQPGTTDIALNAGWNLVGFSSRTSLALPDALSLHGVSDFSLVYAYHAGDMADPWKRYDSSASSGNDLPELAPGSGYWIETGAAHTWDVSY